MMKKRRNISISVLLIFGMFVCMLTGCSGKSGKEEKVTEIEILQYKQEAAAYFEKVEENEKNEEIFAISDKNMLNELSV